jgi:hypothetical protein
MPLLGAGSSCWDRMRRASPTCSMRGQRSPSEEHRTPDVHSSPLKMGVVLHGVEGDTDVPFAEKLIRSVGREPARALVAGGASQLDSAVRRWNTGMNRQAMRVLRDWDRRDHVPCASALIAKLTSGRLQCRGLALRVPVRALESWILADATACRRFFAVTSVPRNPDTLDDPKGSLVDLCRRSRSREIRDGMVPSLRSGRRGGASYRDLVTSFGRDEWDPERARKSSPSLDRAMERLSALVQSRAW